MWRQGTVAGAMSEGLLLLLLANTADPESGDSVLHSSHVATMPRAVQWVRSTIKSPAHATGYVSGIAPEWEDDGSGPLVGDVLRSVMLKPARQQHPGKTLDLLSYFRPPSPHRLMRAHIVQDRHFLSARGTMDVWLFGMRFAKLMNGALGARRRREALRAPEVLASVPGKVEGVVQHVRVHRGEDVRHVASSFCAHFGLSDSLYFEQDVDALVASISVQLEAVETDSPQPPGPKSTRAWASPCRRALLRPGRGRPSHARVR